MSARTSDWTLAGANPQVLCQTESSVAVVQLLVEIWRGSCVLRSPVPGALVREPLRERKARTGTPFSFRRSVVAGPALRGTLQPWYCEAVVTDVVGFAGAEAGERAADALA